MHASDVVTDGPPPLGGLSDAEVLSFCVDDERERRRTEGLIIHGLIELERRKLYTADGYRDLATWGQGAYRWQPEVARARRNLAKLAITCPQVIEQLLTGRLGVDQAHLIGRAFRWPRVGIYVPMFIDDILEYARALSYAEFAIQLREWRSLVDQDGPDPERAHRDRAATLAFTDHEFRFVVTGPNIDGVVFKELLVAYEQDEFEADWAACVAEWGDEARPDLMPRSAHQRRYDAFIRLLSHVGRPVDTSDPDETEPDDSDAERESGDPDESADQSGSSTRTAEPGTCSCGAGRRHRDPVQLVTDIVIDWRTYRHELDRVMGLAAPHDLRSPFGPDRAFSHTLDGIHIDPRDAVLASLYGKMRLVVTDDDGLPIQMTSASRLFTGRMRDAVLMTAIRCTHTGCDRGSTDCQIDHTVPWSEGGRTRVRNGNPGCRHHNLWRHLTGARVSRRRNGTWVTFRADGTEVAPPL